MLINRIQHATRIMAVNQPEYLQLPIRDLVLADGTPCMVSSWQPTPDELERLNQGASVLLSIIGNAHPPVMVMVDKPLED